MLLEWAVQHIPLQQMHFYISGQVPCAVLGMWGRLARERPQLQLRQQSEAELFSPFEDSFKTRVSDTA